MWLGISLACAFISCGVLLWGLFRPLWARPRQDAVLPKTWWSPWWQAWVEICRPFFSWRYRLRLQRLLRLDEIQIEVFFARQCAGAMLGALVGVLVGGIWMGVIGLGLGFYLPILGWQRRLRLQQQQMQYDFPFMLDLLTLSLEAGMGAWMALQLCVQHLPDQALRAHLQKVLDELRTGVPRDEVLTRLANQVDLDEMQAFVAAWQQSLDMGVSLGPLLRQQAQQRRQERFLRAEKKAMEAPVKMLFPLVTCIFPCTFLVIGYPLVFQLWHAF